MTKLFLISFLFATVCLAESLPPTLDFQTAIKVAVENNPDLKKAELKSNSTSWGQLEALSKHLPHLDISGRHFLDAKYSRLGVVMAGNQIFLPSAYPQSQVQVEASILLFDGLGSINRYRASLYENEASQLELQYARFRLEEWIQIKFQEVLAAQEFAKVTQQSIETLDQHFGLARASQRAGFSTKVDVLRIDAQLEEARAEILLSADNIAIAKQALFEAMGIETDTRPFVGELPYPNRNKVSDSLRLDVSERPDVQAELKKEKAQNSLNGAAMSEFFPTISLFGAKEFYKFGRFDPAVVPNDSFQSAYSVGLRLSWNIFDGGGTMAKKAQADNAARIAEQSSRKTLLASPREFDIWKRKYIYNSALFAARKRAVEKSTESVRLATIAVRAGAKTHSETLDAELELFRARAGVVRAQLDASEALAHLELAVGHRL